MRARQLEFCVVVVALLSQGPASAQEPDRSSSDAVVRDVSHLLVTVDVRRKGKLPATDFDRELSTVAEMKLEECGFGVLYLESPSAPASHARFVISATVQQAPGEDAVYSGSAALHRRVTVVGREREVVWAPVWQSELTVVIAAAEDSRAQLMSRVTSAAAELCRARHRAEAQPSTGTPGATKPVHTQSSPKLPPP